MSIITKKRIFFMLITAALTIQTHCITIILDPAGDAKQTGRIVGDSFERVLTLNCAHELKRELEATLPSCTVALTRYSGQEINPLENASFSNKLNPALYISLHAFAQARGTKPTITLYQLALANDFVTKSYDLTFIPIDEAHRAQREHSMEYANKLFNQLCAQSYQTAFLSHGPYRLPFCPLLGIQAPAFSLELGLVETQDWKLFIQPLAASIAAILRFS